MEAFIRIIRQSRHEKKHSKNKTKDYLNPGFLPDYWLISRLKSREHVFLLDKMIEGLKMPILNGDIFLDFMDQQFKIEFYQEITEVFLKSMI